MGKIFMLIAVFIVICALWSLPFYLVMNLFLWLFNIPFHISWLQAFGVCLLASVIKNMLFKKED